MSMRLFWPMVWSERKGRLSHGQRREDGTKGESGRMGRKIGTGASVGRGE